MSISWVPLNFHEPSWICMSFPWNKAGFIEGPSTPMGPLNFLFYHDCSPWAPLASHHARGTQGEHYTSTFLASLETFGLSHLLIIDLARLKSKAFLCFPNLQFAPKPCQSSWGRRLWGCACPPPTNVTAFIKLPSNQFLLQCYFQWKDEEMECQI